MTLTRRAFSLLLTGAPEAVACSVPMCLGDGPAFASRFRVRIHHDKRPIVGAIVQIEGGGTVAFSGVTQSDGTVHVPDLPSGTYWLTASYLDVNAASHCFHIASRPKLWVKRSATYEWGNYPLSMRTATGRFVDSRPSESETSAILRSIRRTLMPMKDVKVTLQDPFSGQIRAAQSDTDGRFLFAEVQSGLYVLRFEGPGTTPQIEATSLAIRVGSPALGEELRVTHWGPQAGACGDFRIELAQGK